MSSFKEVLKETNEKNRTLGKNYYVSPFEGLDISAEDYFANDLTGEDIKVVPELDPLSADHVYNLIKNIVVNNDLEDQTLEIILPYLELIKPEPIVTNNLTESIDQDDLEGIPVNLRSQFTRVKSMQDKVSRDLDQVEKEREAIAKQKEAATRRGTSPTEDRSLIAKIESLVKKEEKIADEREKIENEFQKFQISLEREKKNLERKEAQAKQKAEQEAKREKNKPLSDEDFNALNKKELKGSQEVISNKGV